MPDATVTEANRKAWVAEHDTIHGTLMRLSDAVGKLADADLAGRLRRKMRGDVERLLEKLNIHFRRETDPDAIFDTIRSILPDVGGTIDRLAIEHEEFVAILERALTRLDDPHFHDAGELAAEIDRLADRLFKHEAVEEQLTRRALDWETPTRR